MNSLHYRADKRRKYEEQRNKQIAYTQRQMRESEIWHLCGIHFRCDIGPVFYDLNIIVLYWNFIQSCYEAALLYNLCGRLDKRKKNK